MKKKRSFIVLAALVLALPMVLFSCTACGIFGGGNNDNDNDNDIDETYWWGEDNWHDFVTDASGNRVTDSHGNFITRPPQNNGLDGYRFVTNSAGHRVTDSQGNYLVYPPNGHTDAHGNPLPGGNQTGVGAATNPPQGNNNNPGGNNPGGNQAGNTTTTTTRPPTTVATTTAATTTTTVTIPVQNVSIGPANMSQLPVGGSGQITANVTPPNATNRTVEFRSDNPTVATVNPSTGEVTAVNPGNTVIRAYIDGQRQASMPVTVNPVVNIVGPNTVADAGTITLQARDQNNNLHTNVTWSVNPTTWATITPGSGTASVTGRRPAGWTGGEGSAVVTASVTVNGVTTTVTHPLTVTG
ncbi:MAG: Ig-like domain-containing protein [Oscillospiraceae bacterium]|nr:Ig-like domain-containing protein [Oscillospiraceae bacterium]